MKGVIINNYFLPGEEKSQLIYNYLRGRRVFTELKNLQSALNKRTAVKSFLATAVLAASIATVVLCYANSSLLGIGIGLIILSAYAITYYWHQFKENNTIFRQAKSALNHFQRT